MLMGFDEVVDGEEVFAVVETGAAADDLFEFDHGVDGAHEDDVADVAGVDAGGEFLGGGEDGGDGFLVVLKFTEVLFAERAVFGGDALAVAGVGAGFHLVDEIAHGEGVELGGAEDEGFFVLVDLAHEEFDAVGFAFFDFDDLVEVFFDVAFFRFDFAFEELVVGGVDVFVEGGGDLFDAEGGEEAVVDAFLEGVDVDGFAEVFVGVDVVFAFGGGGEAELDGGGEVFEDVAPGGFVVSAAAVAFVDDDEVEEVGGVFAEVEDWSSAGSRSGVAHRRFDRRGRRHHFWEDMKVWKMVKKTLALVGTRPFFLISSGLMRARASSGKAEKAL